MAQLAKKHRYQGPGTLGNPDNFRMKLFEACGLTEDRQASLMNKAVDRLEKDLDAVKTLPVVSRSGVTLHTIEDNIARAKARDQIFKLTGANAPNTALTHKIITKLEIAWPEYMKPTPQVIDTQAVEPQAVAVSEEPRALVAPDIADHKP